MAENKENKQELKQEKQESLKKLKEYIEFRNLSIEEIKALPTVGVKLEKRVTQYGTRITLTVEFDELHKKVIDNSKIIDERKYNLIVASRNDFNPEDNIHLAKLPVRYLQRHDENGEVKYSRFEVMFTRKVVISDFFDYVDQDLIEALGLKLDYIEDKDSEKEFTIANANVDYVHFT